MAVADRGSQAGEVAFTEALNQLREFRICEDVLLIGGDRVQGVLVDIDGIRSWSTLVSDGEDLEAGRLGLLGHRLRVRALVAPTVGEHHHESRCDFQRSRTEFLLRLLHCQLDPLP